MKRAPRSYKSGNTMKARTAAALVTDHKRKAAAACIPDLYVIDGINYTTELHAAPRTRPVLKGLISDRKGKRLDHLCRSVAANAAFLGPMVATQSAS